MIQRVANFFFYRYRTLHSTCCRVSGQGTKLSHYEEKGIFIIQYIKKFCRKYLKFLYKDFVYFKGILPILAKDSTETDGQWSMIWKPYLSLQIGELKKEKGCILREMAILQKRMHECFKCWMDQRKYISKAFKMTFFFTSFLLHWQMQ